MYDCPHLGFCRLYQAIPAETDASSKDRLGAVLSQKQMDGWYHPVAYGSRVMPHEKNYHSTKLEFLALKWAVTEHFKEYLPYQPFLVKTDNNPLTHIMTTPNLNPYWSPIGWISCKVQLAVGIPERK